MFSVIIPLYNKAPYIAKAVQSVLNQTFQDFELIVVNDGSTDNSLEIVRRLQGLSKTSINILDQTNAGVSTARNNGVRLAKKDYIAFLDADDWWLPEYLTKIKELIEGYPDVAVFGTNYYWFKNGRQRKAVIGLPDNYSGYLDYFRSYRYAWSMPLTSISTVVKKQVFLNLKGFNPDLKFGEDFDLFVRLAFKYKIAYFNKPLAYYNQNVATNERALGFNKIWKPCNHFIFNLDHVRNEEKDNLLLKELLDGLRVRSLIKYHLSGKYLKETQSILKKVDFSKQPKYFSRIYHWPRAIIKLYFFIKKIGSFFKQKLIVGLR